MAEKVMDHITRLSNNNKFVNALLGGAFIAFAYRSHLHQREIETLEADRESLTQSNKALKNSIWDTKQTLYADASSPDSAIVPLSKLKLIYGDVKVPALDGQDTEERKKSSEAKKILI